MDNTMMDSEDQSSVPMLIQKLCDRELAARHRRHDPRMLKCRVRHKRRLRLKAWDTLMKQLPGPHCVEDSALPTSKLGQVEKMYAVAFQLRQNRQFDKASHLEQLTETLYNDTEDKSMCDTIMAFLLSMTNTEASGGGSVLGHDTRVPIVVQKQQDPVLLPEGPLLYGDTQHCVVRRSYMHYPSYIFEKPIVVDKDISEPGKPSLTEIFQATPGTHLSGNGLFEAKGCLGDSYERSVQSSLYGALVRSRTTTVELTLELPDLADSSQPPEIRVPKIHENLEDEGFVETLSSSSSCAFAPEDSGYGRENQDGSIWDKALTYVPCKHRVWENLGKFPQKTERPYVTEAGPEVLDRLWAIHMDRLHLIDPSIEVPVRRAITMDKLVTDVINLLIGVPSTSFVLNEATSELHLLPGLHMSGLTPEGTTEACRDAIECGIHYLRLAHFSETPVVNSFDHSGLIFQAFLGGVRKYLQHYRGCILSIPHGKTLMEVNFLLERIMLQMRFLAKLCHCTKREIPVGDDTAEQEAFPTGVNLLSYLYNETLEVTSSLNYPMMLSLLSTAAGPYLVFVQDWVFHGICRDRYKEFMIEINSDYLSYRDKHYWTEGYRMIATQAHDSVPLFLAELANDIFVCGKSINLLKLCAPEHFLFTVDQVQPRVQVTFSEREIASIETTCQEYLSRMMQIARMRHKAREQLQERAEQAKQNLIIQARQAAALELERLQEITLEREKAEDARKRKLFSELKQQMEDDLARRASVKQKEKTDDKAMVATAVQQEIIDSSVNKELEQQAREDLINYYEKLSAEATLREQRALWKVRRSRLDLARQAYLQAEADQLQQDIQQYVVDNPDPELLLQHGVSSPYMPKWAQKALNPVTESPLPHWARKGLQSIGESDILDLEFAADGENLADAASKVAINLERVEEKAGDDDMASRELKGEDRAEVKQHVSSSVIGDIMRSEPTQKAKVEPTTYIGPTVPSVPGTHHPSASSIQSLMYSEPVRKEDRIAEQAVEQLDKAKNTEADELLSGSDNQEPASSKTDSMSVEEAEQIAEKTSEKDSPLASVTPRSQVKLVAERHVSVESTEDTPSKSSVRLATDKNVLTESEEAKDKISVKLIDDRHVSQETEPSDEVKQHIKLSQTMHATTESEETEDRVHLKTVADCHANKESEYKESKFLVKMSESRHASKQSEGDVQKPIQRNFYGHVSELSREGYVIDVPKLKTFKDRHASKESDFRSFQVKAHRRKKVEESSIESQSTEEVYRPKIRVDHSQHVSHESKPELDPDDMRLAKFKERNVGGHSSDSTVQRLLYGERDAGEEESKPVVTRSAAEVVWADAVTVEPYEDNFDHLNNPPAVDLMASYDQFLLGNIGDYGISTSSDVAAHDFISLPVLLKRSVTAPLVAQISLVNQSIVSHFISELHMDGHLKSLRHYMLMRDGEFGQSLSEQLFEKLARSPKPHELLNPMFLNNVLSKALRVSMQGNTDYAQNLSFTHKYLPSTLNYNALNVLDCLNLTYKVEWPMNIVITENSLTKYSRVFTFMLQLKRAVWILKDVWHKLKRDALINNASGGSQFRQLQLFRHEMQFFVRVMQEYIANQVIHVTWNEFKNDLSNNVHNLDDLHTCHGEYLNKCLARCLLNQKAAPVMKIIQDIFGLILTFRSQLKSHAWQRRKEGSVTHPVFEKMCATYNSFNDYSRFLFKVVRKLAIKGYQPHLQELLLRLNYNHYYSADS